MANFDDHKETGKCSMQPQKKRFSICLLLQERRLLILKISAMHWEFPEFHLARLLQYQGRHSFSQVLDELWKTSYINSNRNR